MAEKRKVHREMDQITFVTPDRPHNPNLPKNYYFDNEYVESLLEEYVRGGCVSKKLRDHIMEHASELIRQIIRTHKLHLLTGREGTSFGDLYQLAWCVTPDTIVLTDKGARQASDLCNSDTIGEIDENIFGLNGLEKAVRYIKKPKGNVRKIKIKFEYEISATDEHPFWVLSHDGPIWKSAGDLKTGDLLAVQNNQNCFGNDNKIVYEQFSNGGNTKMWHPPSEITEELAYIIGLIIAKGSIEKYRVTIYNVNNKIHDILKNNDLDLNFRINKKHGYAVINSVCFVRYLDAMGLGPNIKPWTKIIPKCLMKCSKNIISALIRGMFDGDGHSNNRIGAVGYTSTSIELIKTLKVLLLNFGIVTKISASKRKETKFNHSNDGRMRTKNEYVSPSRTCYQLSLSTVDSRRFHDTIGFGIDYKNDKKQHLPGETIKLDRYVIDHFKILFEVAGRSNCWYKKHCGLDMKLMLKRKWCTKEVADQALQHFNDFSSHKSYKYIQDRIKEKEESEVRIDWLPVESIEDYMSETICFRVEPSNTFTANGFVTHNCQIESSLYKFDARSGHTKVFNMWCVSPDTILMTDHGFDTIGRMLYTGSGIKNQVYGLDGFNKLSATLCRPNTETLKIKTRLGYQVEVTPEHRLYVLKEQGPKWVEAGDLNESDLLGIQYDQGVFHDDDKFDVSLERKGNWNPPKEITEELAYIIGLYIAKGSWSYDKLAIYNIDRDVIDTLLDNKLGLNFIHEPQHQGMSLCNVRFIEFMQALGFRNSDHSDTKYIPAKLLSCSKKVIRSLLRGMFDGDGHVFSYNGQVGYTSNSIFLINQLRNLLLNFGILSKLSYDNRTLSDFDEVVCRRKVGYQLSLSTSDSAKYYNEIGFNIQRKSENYKNLKSSKTEMFGLIPYFKDLKNKYGCGSLGYNKIRSLIRNQSGICYLSQAKQRLESWEQWSSDPSYQFIKDRIEERIRENNKIIWLPIVEIKQSQSPVCEITVDSPNHSYIANGFISHNSQVAKTVMLAHIKKESRDKRNYGAYKEHLDTKDRPVNYKFERFVEEAKEIFKFDEDGHKLVEAMQHLADTDYKPHDGLIDKLSQHSGLSRNKVSNLLRVIRLRSYEFSDSPLNNQPVQVENKYRVMHHNYEPDED